MSKSLTTTGPNADIAEAIQALRKKLGLTQAQFAEKAMASQNAVSDWEKGKKKPTRHWGRLISLADGDSRQTLLRLADIYVDDGGEIPERTLVPVGSDWPDVSPSVEIILLKDPVAAGPPTNVNPRDIDRILALPRFMVPRPRSTLAVRVNGYSMFPVLDDGYICLVDTSQSEKRRMANAMVLARDPSGGVTIKWLQNHGDKWVLVPQSSLLDNRQETKNEMFIMDDRWEIVGQVVLWIAHPLKRFRG